MAKMPCTIGDPVYLATSLIILSRQSLSGSSPPNQTLLNNKLNFSVLDSLFCQFEALPSLMFFI